MRFRRYLRALGPALLLAVGGAYALASLDWCNWPQTGQPGVLGVGTAKSALRAGASKVQLTPPFPIVIGGYGPPRNEASKAAHPLYARATVLEMGGIKVGVVSVELLLVTERIAAEVQERVKAQGFSDVWIAATHTHSSFGGFDRRLISEFAGTGSHREAAELAVIAAAATALEQAAAKLTPATAEASEGKFPEFVEPRTDGPRPTGDLLHLVFRDAQSVIAHWVFFGAHPTNVKRDTEELDGDYPGYLSRALESKDEAPALFLQRAVGNAGPGNAEGEGSARAEAMSKRIVEALEKMPLVALDNPTLSFARVEITPPAPDASRLVPTLFSRPGANFLCRSAPELATVSALQLGPYRFLSVPGEPTEAAAEVLQASSRARVVGLVNGYLGYIEGREFATKGTGESKRQYFDPALVDHLNDAASAVGALLP